METDSEIWARMHCEYTADVDLDPIIQGHRKPPKPIDP
jgi:hypothetical protein